MSEIRWMTVRDVAESLKVHEETVRRWIRRGDLVALDLGGPRAGYRVRPSDLDQFIENNYNRPQKESVAVEAKAESSES
jgi:excisionase family DNA binding protein